MVILEETPGHVTRLFVTVSEDVTKLMSQHAYFVEAGGKIRWIDIDKPSHRAIMREERGGDVCPVDVFKAYDEIEIVMTRTGIMLAEVG